MLWRVRMANQKVGKAIVVIEKWLRKLLLPKPSFPTTRIFLKPLPVLLSVKVPLRASSHVTRRRESGAGLGWQGRKPDSLRKRWIETRVFAANISYSTPPQAWFSIHGSAEQGNHILHLNRPCHVCTLWNAHLWHDRLFPFVNTSSSVSKHRT